jgi:hypothetical protein
MFGPPLIVKGRCATALVRAARRGPLKLPLTFVLLLMPVCANAQTGGWKRITPTKRGVLVSPNNNMSAPEPVKSVRLIFEYEGDKVRLVSQQPVDMVVTGFDLPLTEQLAYHVEARDVNDKTLARVPARNALERSMEVFPEHPGEPIIRHDVPVPKGAFTVVVPAPPAAHHVTLVRIEPGKPVEGLAVGAAPPKPEVVDLVSFPLNVKH